MKEKLIELGGVEENDMSSSSGDLLLNDSSIMKINKAYTMAEALVTLAILGVVATLIIPATIQRGVTTQHKTQIKKAVEKEYVDILRGSGK